MRSRQQSSGSSWNDSRQIIRDDKRLQLVTMSGLAGLPLAVPTRRPDATHVFHQYVIRLAERDPLRDRLRAAGIGTGIHYPAPVHGQPAYEGRLVAGPSGQGVTERAAAQILSLPVYTQRSDGAVERVIAEIRMFFALSGSVRGVGSQARRNGGYAWL
jgi:dTDP-4-amino-4,6-dideoxygalactose transaminase